MTAPTIDSPVAKLKALLADPARREAAAAKVKTASDFTLPKLRAWNSSPCRAHRRWENPDTGEMVENKPKPGCQKCGIIPRKHQRIGITWLFLKYRALLADSVGTGKTIHGAGLIAMLKETGELNYPSTRVIVIAKAQAVLQWVEELRRMLPSVVSIAAVGSRAQREDLYAGAWEVVVIGPEMLLRDWEIFRLHFGLAAVIVDDVDALRNPSTQTAFAIKKLAEKSPRYVAMTGTPLQKKLIEMYGVLGPMGAYEIFGSRPAFERRYIEKKTTTLYLRNGQRRDKEEIVAYKNLDEFKAKIAPVVLRRTADDIDDVDLPKIMPHSVWLEMHPEQKKLYAQLQKDTKAAKKDATKFQAISSLHQAQKITAGLSTLGYPDGPGMSIKLDWIMSNVVEGDLSGEKVVIFGMLKSTIEALQARLHGAGVHYVTIWGNESNKALRQERISSFRSEKGARLLLGTSAIEQSINLQVARHLVNIDQIPNPARMTQLSGRIRRDGSAYKSVYVHNLLIANTHEERYIKLLEREQALADYVWEEQSELFEALTPLQLMSLITG